MLQHSLLTLPAPLSPADLCQVTGAIGLIVTAQPDGGRPARRSQSLLLRLQARSLCTLDLDLLSRDEAEAPGRVQDVTLMAQRLDQVLSQLPESLRHLPVGLLASETGTAAALLLAVQRPRAVRAIVSRSGRPDLVEHVLGDVRVPTLLIVGAGDTELVDLSRQSFAHLRGEKRIDLVPRATHHFLEAGTMDVAAQLAGDWFDSHFAGPPRTA
jgi:putative phosphoribosyl transferase